MVMLSHLKVTTELKKAIYKYGINYQNNWRQMFLALTAESRQCEECAKFYQSRKTLYAHTQRCEGSDEKVFLPILQGYLYCLVCDYRIEDTQELKARHHLLSHEEKDLFAWGISIDRLRREVEQMMEPGAGFEDNACY